MEDDTGLPIDLKNLANLRVVDLKQELEKRGLSKSGSKKDLVKRLKQQLDFEERKHSSGDEDLKFQLDAVTEQNEFVQQYLAQKQKIFAEQKEAKRLSELGEIQKSSDEQEATDEASDSESPVKPTSSKRGTKNSPKHEEVSTSSELNLELSVKDIKKSSENQVSSDDKDKKLKKDEEDVKESNAQCQIEKEKGHKITIKLHVKDPSKQKVESLVKDNQTEDKSGSLEIKETAEDVSKSEDPAFTVTKPEDTEKAIKRGAEVDQIKATEQESQSEKKDFEEEKIVPDAPDQETTPKPRGPSTPPYPCNSSEELEKDIKMDQDAKSPVLTNGKSNLLKEDILIKNIKNAPQKEISEKDKREMDMNYKSNEKEMQPKKDSIKDIKDKKGSESYERDGKPTLKKTDAKNESKEDMKSSSDVKEKDKGIEQKHERSSRDKAKRSRGGDPRGSSSDSSSSESNERSRAKKTIKSSHRKRSKSDSESASSDRENKRSHKTRQSHKSRHKESRSSRSESTSSERNVKKSHSKKIVSRRKDRSSSRSESASSEREMKKSQERTRKSSRKKSGDLSRSKSASSEREMKRSDDKVRKTRQVECRDSSKSKSTIDDRDMKKSNKIGQSREREAGSPKSVSSEREMKKSHEKDNRSPSRSKSKSIDRDIEKSDDKIRHHLRETRSPKSVSSERETERSSDKSRKSHKIDIKIPSRSKSKSAEKEIKQISKGRSNEKDTKKSLDETTTRDTQRENKHPRDHEKEKNLHKSERSAESDEKRASEDGKVTVVHMKDTGSPPRKKHSRNASSDRESQSDSSDTYSKNKLSKKRKTSRSASSSESQESDNECGRNQKPLDKRKHSPVKIKEPASSNSETSIAASKQRPKIKRDNVVVHVSSHSESKSATRDKTSSRTERKSDAARILNYRSTSSSHSENVEESMETVPKVESVPIPKYTSRKIALSNRKKSLDQEEPKSKRSKWGGLTSHQKQSQSICISSDSLKNWFPDLKLVTNASTEEETVPVTPTAAIPMEVDIAPPKPVEEFVPKQREDKENMQLEDTGEASRFLLVENLVRPFTLNQLKDLLRQTGRFVEESFWIDKIKSKCIVTYETEDEALQTRLALHNTRWPSSNPKILNIQYSSAEELENSKNGTDVQKPPVPEVKTAPMMEPHEMAEVKIERLEDSHRRKERKHREPPMREWDRDKIVQESPERTIHHKKEDKKGKKHDIVEDTPAKLLDDLFQKTKSTPCIYWLPLTEEQVKERDAARQKRRTEREKVRQEQSSKGQRRSASRSPTSHRR